MKGVTLKPGSVITLELDGTLVFIEDVTDTFAAVVALPDQPSSRKPGAAFTPGRVGVKKISPFMSASKEFARHDLSERNAKFLDTYEQLRGLHGSNFVDRTIEEQAAYDAAMNPPSKDAIKAAKAQERAEKKAAKKATAGPRFLQRCETCGEQPGHPNHGTDEGKHEFVAPPLPAIKCAACDEEESHEVHGKPKEQGGHKFIASAPVKQPRAPREPKPGKPIKVKPGKIPPAEKYSFIDDATRLQVLRAANGKYNEGNSGNAAIEVIKSKGADGCAPIDLLGLPRCPSTYERAEQLFQQLLGVGLLAKVG